MKKAAKIFSGGTHYKPETAEAMIDQSDHHENTKAQLWWLFKRMRYPFNLELLEDDSTSAKLSSDSESTY